MNTHLRLKNNIKIKRKEMKYTQDELAKIIGISKNTISDFERGKYTPSAYIAIKMCKILNCKFEDLFYLADDYSTEK